MTDASLRAVMRLRAGARVAALFAAAVGLLVLAGWLFDVRAFLQVLSGQLAMVANTAASFVLVGLALWWQAGVQTRSSQSASRAAAALAGLIGLMSLAEYVSGENFGIDELLFRDPRGLTGIYKGMAIHTALAFLVLSIGALLARGDGGFSRLILSDTAGGAIARRIVPAALAVPLLLGWLDSLAERARLYGTELGNVLSAVANASLLLAVFCIVAERLRRTDEEAQRSQYALSASEHRYQDLAAFAPIGIYRSTREGRFVSANMALARMLGYESPEDVLRLDLRKDLYHDNADREPIITELARLGGAGTFEVRWKRRDGAPLWVRLDTRVVRGESGGIEYEAFVHNVDQRKKAEEALRRSEERFHRAFSVSPARSEEHTSELQSRPHLVCRLLLEKKKKNTISILLIKKKKINKK